MVVVLKKNIFVICAILLANDYLTFRWLQIQSNKQQTQEQSLIIKNLKFYEIVE
jgi:hypothetical protein